MKKQFLIFLILSLGVTSVNAQNNETENSHSNHGHKPVIISDDRPIPNIDLVVYKDSKKGWNLEIKLKNFVLAPEMVNKANQPNEGHAHLYINGKKTTRIYGNWYYLSELPLGRNEIKVELNTNSHERLMYKGEMIEDIEIIEVK